MTRAIIRRADEPGERKTKSAGDYGTVDAVISSAARDHAPDSLTYVRGYPLDLRHLPAIHHLCSFTEAVRGKRDILSNKTQTNTTIFIINRIWR